MKYLLDTNACIRFLNGRSEPLRKRVLQTNPEDIFLCSVVKAELFYGAMKSRSPVRALEKQHQFVSQFISLPFDDSAAEIYSQIRANLEKGGTPIGPYDLQIAAIAISNELTLVSHNLREFSRVQNLSLDDWEARP
jgi:tRNA(fMet)-specific endonuclease VapC